MRTSRRWWLAGLVVPLAAAGWWLAAGNGADGDWVRVERDDLVFEVEVGGTLQALDSGMIGPPQLPEVWNYKIAFLAPEGATVKKGEKILGFDTSELEQQLQQQQAEAQEAAKQIEKTRRELELSRARDRLQLEEAYAQRRKAELLVDVPEELGKSNELAAARLDLELARRKAAHHEGRIAASERAASARLAALENQRRQAEAKVEQLQRSIAAMSVGATRDGTVVYVGGWNDEKKKVGDNCWRGDQVIELPDLGSMQAKGEVDEADAGSVEEGQPVTLRLDAHPDVEFAGTVTSIWRTVQGRSWRQQIKVVKMDIDLAESDPQRMRPGMRFRGEVETGRLADVLVVPVEAVFTTPTGPVVYRRTLLGHEAVRVELGRRSASRVEVLAGLAAGDRVSRTEPPA